jgi:hypothetical protein
MPLAQHAHPGSAPAAAVDPRIAGARVPSARVPAAISARKVYASAEQKDAP